MTHRGRPNKKDRVLRYLDLSFEGRQHQNNGNIPSNGLRPSGQGRIKGVQRQASSSASHHHQHQQRGSKAVHKPVDYRSQLESDMQRLLEAERANHPATTGWAGDVTRQPAPSPEPPVQQNYRMASSKLEQQGSGYQYNKVAAAKAAKAASAEGAAYYRPNTAHKYLMATEKRPRTAGYDGEHRLGRPTRTTLLRARQRCNSAPITSYETRHEQQRRAEQQAEVKKQYSSQTNQSLTDLLSANIPAGESLHSYLIGARYNRAHHLDDKSLKDHGVYLPRYSNGGPQNCFIIKKMKLKTRESEEDLQQENEPEPPQSSQRPMTGNPYRRQARPSPTPSTPTQHTSPSPNSQLQSYTSKRTTYSSKSIDAQPSLVITPHSSRSPPTVNRQAWSEKPRMEVNGNCAPSPETAPPLSVEVTNTNDGINIKDMARLPGGVGFIGSPPKIARGTSGQGRQSVNRPSSSGQTGSVIVLGRSIYSSSASPMSGPSTPAPAMSVPMSSSAPQLTPANTPRAMMRPKSSVGGRRQLTARDVSYQMQQESLDDGELVEEPLGRVSPVVSVTEEQNGETLEVMSTGSEDELGSRMQGPSPSPAGSPRPSPPTSPSLETPREPSLETPREPSLETPREPSLETPREPNLETPSAPVIVPELPVLSQPEPEPTAEPPSDAAEGVMKETPAEIEVETLKPSLVVKPKRVASAHVRKPHVRFADQVSPEDSSPPPPPPPPPEDAATKDPFFITDNKEEDENAGKLDNVAAENGKFAEPVLPAVVVDSGDVQDNETMQQQFDTEENSPETSNNGSGDATKDELVGEGTKAEAPANSLLFPGGVDDADSSVASEEHLPPQKVISVDIVTKVPPSDKT